MKEEQKALEESDWEGVTEHTYNAVSDLLEEEIIQRHWISTPVLERISDRNQSE